MYCGDETGSFVGDIGSHLARFGYGGEDSPSHVVPSYVARFASSPNGSDKPRPVVPTSCYNPRWDNSQFTSALRMAKQSDPNDPVVVDPVHYLQQGDSLAVDSDAYEQLWHSAFDALRVRDSRKHHNGGGGAVATRKNSKPNKNSHVASTTLEPQGATTDTTCVHPLLVVTPGCTHRMGTTENQAAHRKELVQLTELMMEQFDCRALFLAPTPMLAAFSHGRQTALVVDVGAAGCRVTPVVDGLLLKQAQRRNGRGGDWLGNVQYKALQLLQESSNSTAVVRPRYQLHPHYKHAPRTNGGLFHRWAMQDLMYEFRTTSEHVQLPQWAYDPTVPFCDSILQQGNKKTGDSHVDVEEDSTTAAATAAVDSPCYQLPDGTVVDLTTPIGKDLCRVPELLFTDETPLFGLPSSVDILQEHATLSNLPLHKLIHQSLSAVGDVQVRKDLANAILLCGGGSCLGQQHATATAASSSHGGSSLEQRLSLELPRVLASAFKPKVLASRHSVERSCAAWIGGSILTSLGSFQQLWLSREEYDEYGATLAVQRFP